MGDLAELDRVDADYLLALPAEVFKSARFSRTEVARPERNREGSKDGEVTGSREGHRDGVGTNELCLLVGCVFSLRRCEDSYLRVSPELV